MAIALKSIHRQPRSSRVEWRGIAAVLALAVILVGIALSGGLQLPAPVEPSALSPQGEAAPPAYDGRGKWTGYTE